MVWPDMDHNVYWQIEDGKGISFWFDSWLGVNGPLAYYLLEGSQPVHADALVSDMIDADGQWRWNVFESILPYEILIRIVALKVSVHAPMPDFPRWAHTSHGQFQIYSAYSVRVGVQYGPSEPVWKAIAGFKGVPRVRTFMWLACLGNVLTNEVRFQRHLTTDPQCSAFGEEVETIDHLLWHCPSSYTLWCSLVQPEYFDRFFSLSFKDWIFSNLSNSGQYAQGDAQWDLLFGSLVWILWLRRNEFLFYPEKVRWETMLSHGKRL
ncbi:hypothetical protein V6N11_066139 [Hibiscus sabdariffa]|uniref:Reverse transcriptase zinc-binding domain-containing protein n=2 Tax=Hibiscus sabdariffa TaxID=183260 RepID=A0ABR2AGP0_9ROSI